MNENYLSIAEQKNQAYFGAQQKPAPGAGTPEADKGQKLLRAICPFILPE
nr:MAG TPA: hypothetical protein [Caudoviricetes sp.]